MEYLTIDQFLSGNDESPIVDVRTSGEFNKGHIPGAINLQLFSDIERHEIGLLYKEKGKQKAVKRGLELVGPKLGSFINQLENVTSAEGVRVHCWRGGMRSSSMAWLFETAGYQVSVLKDGYKSYRHLMETLFDQFDIALIGGETGSGKTKILHQLRKLGEQVIDLEGLANHKGSAFGAIGQSTQPTSEQFQNEVISGFFQLDPSRVVFLEDESSNIGKVGLPNHLWKKMKQSRIIRISLPLEERVKNLVLEYGKYELQELEACILKIEKKLGGLSTKKSIEALHENHLDQAARAMLLYYDKSYQFLLNRNKSNVHSVISFDKFEVSEMAKQIQKTAYNRVN